MQKKVSHEAGNTVISVLAKTLHQATEVTSIALQNQTRDANQEPSRMRELQISFYKTEFHNNAKWEANIKMKFKILILFMGNEHVLLKCY